MARRDDRYYPRPKPGQAVNFTLIAAEMRHLGNTGIDCLRVYYDADGREVGWRAYRGAKSTVGIWSEGQNLAQPPNNWSLFVVPELGPDHWGQRDHELAEAGAVRYDEYTRATSGRWKLLPPGATSDEQIAAELAQVTAAERRRDLGAYFTLEALALRLADRATQDALARLREAIEGIPTTSGWQRCGAVAFASLAAAPQNDQAGADARRALDLALAAEPYTLITITPYMPAALLDAIAAAAAEPSRPSIQARLRQHLAWRRAALARQMAPAR